MADITYEMLLKRQSLYKKAYAFLCLILILSIGFYSYRNWTEYALAREGLKQNKEFANVLSETVGNEKAAYELEKDNYDHFDKEIEKKLSAIYPVGDDYAALTRQIDLIEKDLSKKNSVFEISSIDYQNPAEGSGYYILPLNMSIRSSGENFTKFLHLMENSGALTNNMRLMDLSSITLNFEDSQEETQEDLTSFSVQVNAYFQK
ncbi:MAG: hypothetical protein AAB540_01535 [Patescibacteria group bacterium]